MLFHFLAALWWIQGGKIGTGRRCSMSNLIITCHSYSAGDPYLPRLPPTLYSSFSWYLLHTKDSPLTLYTITLLTWFSRRAQSGTWPSFEKRVWFTESHIVFVTYFYLLFYFIIIFYFWRNSPQWAMVSFLRFLDHTQRRITAGRTSLDEWSARRRDLYLTTHNTHNRGTSMSPMGFEPTISEGERP